MTVSPIVFFDIVIALFLLSFALLAMAVSYSSALRKIISRDKKYDEIIRELNQKEADLLENARKKEAEIIEEATKKAAQIIIDSQNLNNDARKMLNDALETLIKHQIVYFEKVSGDFLSEYKKELDSLRARTVQIAQNTSRDIEEDTTREVEDFDKILKEETMDAQKIVEGKIEEEYSKTQKEVAGYKEQMLKKIDEDIYKILENVSKAAIGKSIPLAQHEQIIIEALEKAKKDGVGK